jgi:hypothetical protein
MRYYATQKDAEADIKKHVGEVQEFGRNAVTAEDRSMILLARQQLGGSLDLLPQVLEHWRKTGAGSIKPTKVEDAVEEFKEWRLPRVKRRTASDIKHRLKGFAAKFNGQYMHPDSSRRNRDLVAQFRESMDLKNLFQKDQAAF